MSYEPVLGGDRTGRTPLPPTTLAGQGSIPEYLEPYVVDQVPARYTATDHAVWRFVLTMLLDRLRHTAHPSYVRGLAESGISTEHIPSIDEMNRCLARVGWGAVCVDGFIPPRAFQAFQARGILPIAAEIRDVDQLPYTPAPDIIHEAAGHAPILVDPAYAAYVRAIGAVGLRAFASPADARVDRAVRRLSELKESATPAPDELAAAESELAQAIAAAATPSEAARVARLYWWTAEYGLVGTPSDYRLYGAGLLSSLGESHFCHAPEVRKIVLSPGCTEVGYDITRPQPQLFVARDFEHLNEVLEGVAKTLAHRVGGDAALGAALASEETGTLSFEGGLSASGVLSSVQGNADEGLLELAEATLVADGAVLASCPSPFFIPLGPLADGRSPFGATADRAARGGTLVLRYRSGAVVSGRELESPPCAHRGLVFLRDFRLEWRGRTLCHSREPYPLVLARRLITACAGAEADACRGRSLGPASRSASEPRPRVPKPRARSARELELDAVHSALSPARPKAQLDAAGLWALHAELARHPHDWLTRYGLLEHAQRSSPELRALLRRELIALEDHYERRYPIRMGLEYLDARAERGAAELEEEAVMKKSSRPES